MRTSAEKRNVVDAEVDQGLAGALAQAQRVAPAVEAAPNLPHFGIDFM